MFGHSVGWRLGRDRSTLRAAVVVWHSCIIQRVIYGCYPCEVGRPSCNSAAHLSKRTPGVTIHDRLPYVPLSAPSPPSPATFLALFLKPHVRAPQSFPSGGLGDADAFADSDGKGQRGSAGSGPSREVTRDMIIRALEKQGNRRRPGAGVDDPHAEDRFLAAQSHLHLNGRGITRIANLRPLTTLEVNGCKLHWLALGLRAPQD